MRLLLRISIGTVIEDISSILPTIGYISSILPTIGYDEILFTVQ